MADFEISYQKTANAEGGYTDDPVDGGNWTGGMRGIGFLIGTNYGISAPVLMKHLGRVPSVQDMKNIPISVVKEIYKNQYWDPIWGDKILSQEYADVIYDMAVNAGVKTSIVLAQRSVKAAATGKMNQSTLDKINNQT